jgi:hypothetical protein
MGASLKNPCTITLCNLNTTYHFLGRRQTARYVNYSNSQFKSTPHLFLLFLSGYSILHTFNGQYLNCTFILLAILLFATPRLFSILLASLVSSLCLSHSYLCLYIILPRCIRLTTCKTVTHVSPLTNSVLSIKCINFNT